MNNSVPSQLRLAFLVFWTGLVGSALIAWKASAFSGGWCTLLLFSGMMVTFAAWLESMLRFRANLEQVELDRLSGEVREGSLFGGNTESRPAARSLRQFLRYGQPLLTGLVWVGQVFLARWIWKQQGQGIGVVEGQAPLLLGWFTAQGMILFLLGRYLGSLARVEKLWMIRPVSNQLLVNALASGFVGAGAAAVYFGVPRVEVHISHGMMGVAAVLWLEGALNLVLEFYRPRGGRGAVDRAFCESRLAGLVGQPEGLFRTLAQTLDYQFGFKVSDTWFSRYLERSLGRLLLLQVFLVWVSTGVVVLDPHEEAVLERMGRPVNGRNILSAGIHFKLPWPFDRVEVHPAREIRTFNVGFVPDPEYDRQAALVWTKAHYREEFNLLVASQDAQEGAGGNGERPVPVNLLTVSIPVQYRVTNLVQWVYGHIEPSGMLPLLATREVTHYLVNVDPDDFMASGRGRAAAELRELIQAAADRERLGVEVVFVGLQDVHPPVQVAGAFESVIAAAQERETRILDAQGYRAERLPRAFAEADRRLQEQKAESYARVLRSSAQAGRFQHQLLASRMAPGVYHDWTYHEVLTRALVGPRKFVLTKTNTQDQFWLNFEERFRSDLLDIPAMPAAGTNR